MTKYKLIRATAELEAKGGRVDKHLKKSELIDRFFEDGLDAGNYHILAEFDNREEALAELSKYKCWAREYKQIVWLWDAEFFFISEYDVDEDGDEEETGNYDYAEMEEDEEDEDDE